MVLQSTSDIDTFYRAADPWGYYTNPHDARRRTELLAALPRREWGRVLDIGCGNGFITFSLPGREVVGVDVSAEAIRWARQAAAAQPNPERFRFEVGSVLDPALAALGRFDLVVITGVLYEQYIGKASASVRWVVDQLIADGGFVASCQIREWMRVRLPYSLVDVTVYPYREYTHQLEVFRK